MHVRLFDNAHASDVAALILKIQREEFAIPITLEDQPDLQDIPNFYQRGAGNFWVALENEQVVGTIALLDIGAQQGALRKMFVAHDWRGSQRRVADHLLTALLDWSRHRRLRQIFLGTTEHFRAAHKFYEKNLFREIPRSELPPTFPIMNVDTRFFVRTL